jgi:E3 ubiquitin-protein ligase SHPRH
LFHFVKGEVKSFAGKVRETLTIEDKENLVKDGAKAGLSMTFHEEQRKGTWADSEAERLIKAVLKYAKQQGRPSFPPWILKDGHSHVKLLDAMKREFRLMRILWSTVYDQVAAVDEINMSTLRLRLRLEDEPYPTKAVLASMKPKHKAVGNDEEAEEDGSRTLAIRVNDKYETIYILEPHEMSSQRLKLVSEKTIAEHEFVKNHGQLLYLENLKTSKAGVAGNEYPEPCPVCQNPLGAEWNMLQCGHSYCIECLRRLIQEFTVRGTSNRAGRSVRCAICRNLTLHSEVSYVKTKVDSKDESSEDEVYKPVKGSLSTKIEAVVKTLVKIQTQDPSSKSLVFSTWNGVLDILGEALDHNDIKYAALQSKQVKFHRNLQKFKNREDVNVLLLPLKSGANGLNLIEASHVLLVEPILNPAEELQAIGRVHRIGQTKATVVHRFVVQRSMEERIHSMMKSHRQEECERASHCTEENTLTFQDLKSLFVKQNKKDIGEGIEFQFRPMLQDEI